MGVKDLRVRLAETLRKDDPLIVTQHGHPSKVIISYEDMLEIVDILDEMQDSDTIKTILEGKQAVRQGAKGIAVSKLFKRMRARISKRKK
jgi:prevent-host-death family protein